MFQLSIGNLVDSETSLRKFQEICVMEFLESNLSLALFSLALLEFLKEK